MNYSIVGLLLSIGSTLMLAMEPANSEPHKEPSNTTTHVEQIIERKATELSAEYQAQLNALDKEMRAYEAKLEELKNRVLAQSSPPAPPAIASAQLSMPPRPEKPVPSFFENNKKILVIGGIGVAVVTAGGILWKLNGTHAPAVKDYYSEEAR